MRKQAVIIGGACGHQTEESVAFWHRAGMAHLEKCGIDPIVVPYQGSTLSECAESLIEALQSRLSDVPVLAVAYSMGGHVLRLVADKHPDWFDQIILLAVPEHVGMRFAACINFFSALPWPFIRGGIWPYTGSLRLNKPEHVQRFLFQDQPAGSQNGLLTEIMEHCHTEPAWNCFHLGMPVFRKTVPPLRCEQVVAWIPESDGICPHRSYPNEPQIQVQTCEGGHGFVFNDEVMCEVINKSLWMLSV